MERTNTNLVEWIYSCVYCTLFHLQYKTRKHNGELCTWFNKLVFSVFSLKNTLLFGLPCPPVSKHEAVGRRIAKRTKVEQKGSLIFLSGGKIIPTCKSRYTFLYGSRLLTFRNLSEISTYFDKLEINFYFSQDRKIALPFCSTLALIAIPQPTAFEIANCQAQ